MINKRFGSTEYIADSASVDEFLSAKIVTDLNITLTLKTWYSITIGCNNLFNLVPDRVKNYINTNEGKQSMAPSIYHSPQMAVFIL